MNFDNHVSVAIIGGGVAGLTLANILEQAGISFTLWESQSQIAPPAGASIGLMPNGLRILDQIGVIDKVEQYSVPHGSWEHRDADGTLYCTLTALRSYPEMYGYNGFFMERQRLLEILYENIEDKNRVHPGKQVISLQSSETHALVTAADGSQVHCDIVVGADGVHSIVRQQIHAILPSLKLPSDYFASKYACVYGISSSLPQIGSGRNYTIYQSEASLLIFSGAGGTLYWFIFEDRKETVPFGEKKRYGHKDIDNVFTKVANANITAGVTFSDIFSNRRTAIMTAIEEGVAEKWTTGRLVIMGDAAHKMVPHAAMGANQAMESAACFASHLLQQCALPGVGNTLPLRISQPAVQSCLEKYEQVRRARITDVVAGASFTCRAQLKTDEAGLEFISKLPDLTDEIWLAKVTDVLSAAEKIEPWRNSGRY